MSRNKQRPRDLPPPAAVQNIPRAVLQSVAAVPEKKPEPQRATVAAPGRHFVRRVYDDGGNLVG
jgi:hypothetical protein